jgi:signal transduction histidine kinase/CheY-like chemotaxis protein
VTESQAAAWRWLREFASASPEAILGLDSDGRVVFAGARAEVLIGASELVGSAVERVLPGVGESGALRASSPIEVEGTRSDGLLFRARVSLTPLGSGFVALVQDVTARSNLIASERKARAEAERANRLKDYFLATLSHELRTPLNAMLGWTQILRVHGTNTEIGARAVDTIERNIKIQTRLIEDLLDMSSIANGKMLLDIRSVPLAPVIDAALEMVMPAASSKEVTIVRELEPDAPGVLGDPHRLQQIVWNLLTNAVEYTPKGGTVRVSLRRFESFARIDVSDTGEGIEPALLPHVFESFRQADSSTRRRHSGLGLGLSIVRSLVGMHGGEVRAESDGTGKGATFTVLIPQSSPESEQGHEPASGTSTAAGSVARSTARVEGVCVLVVDDEADARESFRLILQDLGATVLVARSAAEALALLDERHPDVMLCDVGMPGEDGYQLIRKVRALEHPRDRDIPAAALTAFTRKEDRAKSLASGFQDHVSKPVEPARLVELVASLAAKRGGTS